MLDLIQQRLQFQGGSNADEAVQQTLDFVNLWAHFNFPRLLRAMNNIQQDVFNRLGMTPGDYGGYASRVESLFIDSGILTLEEYGIPLEVARKLQHLLDSDGNLDRTLEALRILDLRDTDLTDFESEFVSDAKRYL